MFEQIRSFRGDLRMAAQSSSIFDAPNLIGQTTPDAVVIVSTGDIQEAVGLAARIRRVDLDVRVMWWSLSIDGAPLSAALEKFDCTVVAWDAAPDDVITALNIPLMPLTRASTRPRLTQQEQVILQLAAAGLSNRAIAFRLSLSESTIKNHLRHIGAKFNTSSRAQSVWQAVQWGYLKTEEIQRSAS